MYVKAFRNRFWACSRSDKYTCVDTIIRRFLTELGTYRNAKAVDRRCQDFLNNLEGQGLMLFERVGARLKRVIRFAFVFAEHAQGVEIRRVVFLYGEIREASVLDTDVEVPTKPVVLTQEEALV
jgi:hypothetical protein